MSEVQTPEGATYILEWDKDAQGFHHDDLDDDAESSREPWERYTAILLAEEGYQTTTSIEMLWCETEGRAGMAAGGEAVWTDAQSPVDALERYLGIAGKAIDN